MGTCKVNRSGIRCFCQTEIDIGISLYSKIHVSNTCNLEYKYCYANRGNYDSMDKIMTRNTARKLSEIIINNFNNINKITFFGGEPLLGIDAIEEICSNLSQKKISYNIITNLTLIDDNVIKILDKYRIKITESIDGAKEIHDFNRIFKNGKGTYDIIAKNVNTLQTRGLNLACIEGTYTENSAAKYSRQQIASILYLVLEKIAELQKK
ncbi:radical SAM protein [Tissierella sp.]|uniref:radical SAM protein n=1 Tax=Tissierella sp. TaxID=41274 RepID=UPI0028AAE9D4|nr:radical SAM protein [Tissierella sp.]